MVETMPQRTLADYGLVEGQRVRYRGDTRTREGTAIGIERACYIYWLEMRNDEEHRSIYAMPSSRLEKLTGSGTWVPIQYLGDVAPAPAPSPAQPPVTPSVKDLLEERIKAALMAAARQVQAEEPVDPVAKATEIFREVFGKPGRGVEDPDLSPEPPKVKIYQRTFQVTMLVDEDWANDPFDSMVTLDADGAAWHITETGTARELPASEAKSWLEAHHYDASYFDEEGW